MKPTRQDYLRASLLARMSSRGCDMKSLGKFISSLIDDEVIELHNQLVRGEINH